MTEVLELPIEVTRKGDVDAATIEYATKRMQSVLGHVGAPVLFVRVRLTDEHDAHRVRPSLAQATIDINGALVRAHVAADSLTTAIDLLADRLRDQIQHRAERQRARRSTGRIAQPGEWRHGDLRDERSLFADVPPDERQIVERKSFAIDPATPDEAAADMAQLDHDFWLFHDLASDADALIEHLPDGTYVLHRVRPVDAEAGPVAIDVTVVPHEPPTVALDEAIRQLDDSGQRYLFFVDAESTRGNVVYRRYDGHYGLLNPLSTRQPPV